MSDEAKIWADAPLPLDPVSKSILSKLAGVSDVEDCAWMTVPELAERVGCSQRTIQSRLRKLEGADGQPVYIRVTGRTHRYGTRDVPIYELVVDHDLVAAIQERRKGRKRAEAERRGAASLAPVSSRKAVDKAPAMGETVCTHSNDVGGAICTRMGATVCTRNEENRGEGFATLTLQGEREAKLLPADVANRIWSAWPEPGQRHSSERMLAKAVRAEMRAGEALADVLAGSLAYAAKPAAWGASGGKPKAPHNFVGEGCWKTHLPKLGDRAPVVTARIRFASEEVRTAMVGAMGEAWVVSWLDPCAWDEGKRVLDPRLGQRAKRLGEARPAGVLVDLGVTVGKVG